MAHVAINESDDQHDVVDWLTRVTDDEYAARPVVQVEDSAPVGCSLPTLGAPLFAATGKGP